MRFAITALTSIEHALREEVRQFVRSEAERAPFPVGFAGTFDRAFSAALAARGWVGMALPEEYGGSGRTAVDRFVVVSELLAANAPTSYHWVADRQTAPTILRYGSPSQKDTFLPAIARGECSFCIGMSEPDAGSDLASVRTSAKRADGGWVVNGTKVWTSGAHVAEYMLALVRTSTETDRHNGLTQMIIDLKSPGVTVSPIQSMDGSRHFNEVALVDLFVPDESVVGAVGGGWSQVNSELSFERSGPDRWLSTFQLYRAFLEAGPARPGVLEAREALGYMAAKYRTLYQLSLSIARMVDRGERPSAEAALVKDLGTTFEREVVELIRKQLRTPWNSSTDDPFSAEFRSSMLNAPSLTIRGGATEILRVIAARELMR